MNFTEEPVLFGRPPGAPAPNEWTFRWDHGLRSLPYRIYRRVWFPASCKCVFTFGGYPSRLCHLHLGRV